MVLANTFNMLMPWEWGPRGPLEYWYFGTPIVIWCPPLNLCSGIAERRVREDGIIYNRPILVKPGIKWRRQNTESTQGSTLDGASTLHKADPSFTTNNDHLYWRISFPANFIKFSFRPQVQHFACNTALVAIVVVSWPRLLRVWACETMATANYGTPKFMGF